MVGAVEAVLTSVRACTGVRQEGGTQHQTLGSSDTGVGPTPMS